MVSRPSTKPQQEALLTWKLERKPRGSCHIPKDTEFPVNSREVPIPARLFQWNTEDEVTTRRSTDTLGASSRKSLWFQGQLDKEPDTP